MKVPKPDTLKDHKAFSPWPGLCERAQAPPHDLDGPPAWVPRTEVFSPGSSKKQDKEQDQWQTRLRLQR